MGYTHYSQVFWDQVNKYGDRVAMRYKPKDSWVEFTWKQFGDMVHNTSKALIECGIGEQETVGIFSQNMPQWSIADIGSLCIRAIPVPIYATNTAKQAEYIINHAEIKVIFVGDAEQYSKVMQILPDNKFLQKVIVFKETVPIQKSDKILYFSDFLKIGQQSNKDNEVKDRMSRGTLDDLLTIIYTSGTTGEPKGVMLTHSNALFQKEQHDLRLIDPNEHDISLAFLPLSHVFERIWTYYVFAKGMTNNYLEDPAKIVEFIGEVKPTIMCAVPRFYEKIYATVFNRLESAPPAKQKLFKWAVKVGAQYNNRKKDQLFISPMLRFKHKIADTLVLKKIRDVVGGRIKFFPCAGAPLSQEIEEFFYACGIFICYGYGLTETTATVTCHEQYHFKFGAVGKPLPNVEVKIDPANGEILVRGGNVMKGYYKKPEATAEVLSSDGWFRTGDAGFFEENGELRITERIKDLMKTSGGKYIAPQMIESTIGADHFIEQIAVIGDQRKYVTALVVPSFLALEEYAKAHNISYTSKEDLISKPEIIEFYRQRIDEAQKEFARFEKIKKFTLLPQEFTVESGEITPTLKLKRKVIAEKYKDIIDAMYRDDKGE
ncbi:MAG: long-chain fatty acid--CoA ligase [Spirochaetota bacterium]|nr:long-chain fatty acid--CoA ligase [Spirochaetota bacterium]